MKRLWFGITIISTWLFLVFLIYNYVYLQWALIKHGQSNSFFILGVLIFLSFVLAGAETSISGISNNNLIKWYEDAKKEKDELQTALSQPIFKRIKFIKPVALGAYQLFHLARPSIFVRNVDGAITVEREQVLTMVVIFNNIININITALFMVVLTDNPMFPGSVPALPLVGHIDFLRGWLPLPGSAGFTSIGATALIVFFGEIIPKKLSLRRQEIFLRRSSWLILVIKIIILPATFARGVDAPIALIFDRWLGPETAGN